jgi:monoamine oxidase
MRDCQFSHALPGDVHRFGQTTFRGAYAKAIVVFETAWWRTAGFSGFTTNTKPSKEACASFAYDYGGIENSLVLFITSDVSAEVGALPEDERRKSVLASLELFFPEHKETVAKFIAYHDEFWQNNTLAGGAPMTVYPPGFFATYSSMRLFRNPLYLRDEKAPTIFFAGTDVSKHWSGYMEGACIRGKEVALDVQKVLSKGLQTEVNQADTWRHCDFRF